MAALDQSAEQLVDARRHQRVVDRLLNGLLNEAAHVCETGGARRTWLIGIDKLRKRYSIAAAAHNLGLVMRELFGMGTPRGFQAFADLAEALYLSIPTLLTALVSRAAPDSRLATAARSWRPPQETKAISTGC